MEEITVKVTRYKDRENLVMYFRDPVTEKLVTRSAETSDAKAAERAAAKWEAELREGRYQSGKGLTWAQFRERYEQEKLATLSAHAQSSAAAAFHHLETLVGPKKLASINATLLSKLQTELRNYRRKGPNGKKLALSETTIGAYLAYLKAALGWAVKMKLIREVPQIEMPQQAKGRTMMRGRPITTEEFERLLDKVENVLSESPDVVPAAKRKRTEATAAAIKARREALARDAAPAWIHYLRGLFLSGLRLEESTVVSWEQDAAFSIDLSGRRPRFRIYAEAHKGRRDQFLPMTPDFAAFVLATPEAERHGLLFKLNGQTTGKPLAVSTICRTIAAIGERAGVVVNKDAGKFATAHDLRRAFGTRWARKVAPAILQQLMRHRAIETTMKYYVDLDADDVADTLWRDHGPINKSINTAPQQAPEGEKSNRDESTQTIAKQSV